MQDLKYESKCFQVWRQMIFKRKANDFQAKSKVLTTYTIKIALRIVCITLFLVTFASTLLFNNALHSFPYIRNE